MLIWNSLSGNDKVINCSDYCITEKLTGKDELSFSLPSSATLSLLMQETQRIKDTNTGQWFVLSQIVSGSGTTQFKATLDLEAFEQTVVKRTILHEVTLSTAIKTFSPTGWDFDYTKTSTTMQNQTKDLTFNGGTPLEALYEISNKWNISFRFDTINKSVIVFDISNGYIGGTEGENIRLTTGLNLRSINYTGTATSFCTRLYVYGKNGISIETVNSGLEYLQDNTYSSRLVCAKYSNTSISRPEELLDAGKTELAKRCKPKKSYECDFVDLANAAKADYKKLEIHVPYIIIISDHDRQNVVKQIVTEYSKYYRHPENNKITLSSCPETVQSNIARVQRQTNEVASYCETAQQTADSAVSAAGVAQQTADSANTSASNAQSSADSAANSASKASQNASSALQVANNAESSISSVSNKADEAQYAANYAQILANNAQSTADSVMNRFNSAATANYNFQMHDGSSHRLYFSNGLLQ